MKKLIISLNFLLLTLILLTSSMAGNITYFSPEGKIITDSEYREERGKKAENLAALRKIAAKFEIRKSAGYNAPQKSRKYDFYSGQPKRQNSRSDRKRYYSGLDDKDLENKRLQRKNHKQDNRRIQRDIRIAVDGECPSHLVEIYDYNSEQIKCAPSSVADDLAEQHPNLEIMGQ